MRPTFLSEERRFIIFGGKGGVGKTTSAVACALQLADANLEHQILVASTDPAHSLGDSLKMPIGGSVTPINGVANLFALEMDAQKLLEEFKRKNSSVLEKIADRGTYFDQCDIRGFLELSMPGMDEFMAVLELLELVKSRKFETIVLDTAPTGHTIRLLELPNLLQKWVGVMDMMMQKHRTMSEAFTRRRYQPDECDRWLEALAADAKRVERFFQDNTTTEFVIVTIPEEMAVAESVRLNATLKEYRVPRHNLIINHVVEDIPSCPFCNQRHLEQKPSIAKLIHELSDLHVSMIPQLPYEVQGLDALREIGGYFLGERQSYIMDRKCQPADAAKNGIVRNQNPTEKTLSLPSASLLLIGGKGGVGKSTIAAATALELAAQHPQKKILIFSTDPAHSLSDCFGQKIGPNIKAIQGIGNLYAQEIDAPKLLNEFKDKYQEAIDSVFHSFLGGNEMRVEYEQEVMEQLLDLSPPGIDEVMSLIEVLELMENGDYDVFVLDTAPTGHLLRFLEMPEIAHAWLDVAQKIILKYQGVVSLGSVAGLVMKYSSRIKKLREKLLNADATEIIVVTIPESMAISEMERLISSLQKFRIPCRQIIINMVMPPNKCVFCSNKYQEEQKSISWIESHLCKYRIACILRSPYPLHGQTALTQFQHALWQRRTTL